MAGGHVFRSWSVLLLWWGCLTILYSNNSKGNSSNDCVVIVKHNYWESVAGPGFVSSISQFLHHRQKQRGSFYLCTRVSLRCEGHEYVSCESVAALQGCCYQSWAFKAQSSQISLSRVQQSNMKESGRHLVC